VELETRTASPFSFRFLLRNIVWFGLAHPVKFRLHLVFLHLSGVGVLDGVLLCRLQNHENGKWRDACRAGRKEVRCC